MDFIPKFSVITPTYNRAYCLWRAVQSVLSQTYPFFELLIVDDASSDDTEKMVKQFSDPRIKYFKRIKNVGPSAARNFGLNKAKGNRSTLAVVEYLSEKYNRRHDNEN